MTVGGKIKEINREGDFDLQERMLGILRKTTEKMGSIYTIQLRRGTLCVDHDGNN
jgi:hypothetical protein